MEKKLWVRVARYQLLASCIFTMLLALAVCIVTIMTGWGSYFIVLTKASSPESSIRGLHWIMVLYGSCVCVSLLLVAVVCSLSVLRESQQLMAIGFLGFGCLFLVLMVGLTWAHEYQSQVETSFLDTYDDLYEQVHTSSSSVQREQLLSVHEALLCCGKIRGHSVLSETLIMCKREEKEQVCGMFLSSFLFFSLLQGTSWDRRGKYNLINASNCPSSTMSDLPLIPMPPLHTEQ
ncbi:tetraspanin-32 isoform X2 [Bombina bombina]|uniref:tetraspanin-32 isoform X2 n=1 Tax=Bombina bombina TaxID=8345 RepID=UPI00235A99C0|nr:tetraspanin-32 isoform X2 [Bombina bombina]